MRASEKEKYQQFVDRIEFPMVIFVYETRRIIAINEKGMNILAFDNKQIRYIPDKKFIKHISQYIYNQNNNIEFDFPIEISKDKIVRIDLEVNAIVVDNKHVVLCIFDRVDNHSFSDKLSIFTPRLFWKDKLLKLKGANYFCRDDFKGNQLIGDVEFAYEEDVAAKLNQDETQVIETKEPLWNVMQLIQYKNVISKFVSINRIPILNRNGTLIGILGGYLLLHNKEEYESLFEWLRDENNRLEKLIAVHDGVLFRLRKDKDWTVEYVTSNVSQFGYTYKDFYLRKATMKSLIVEEDVDRIIDVFIEEKKNRKDNIEVEFRIKKADGSKIWVKALQIRTEGIDGEVREDVNIVVTDISKYKRLEEELQLSKDALKFKLDTIKTGELPIRHVHFGDLFHVEEVYNPLKIISEIFNLSCILTDYMGHPLGTIAGKNILSEQIINYYESKASSAVFRDLYKKVRNGDNPIHYDLIRNIYIYSIPFVISGKCIALFNVLTYEKMDDSRKEIQYFTMNIKSLCASVQRNLELIQEKEHTEVVKRKLAVELETTELFNNLLTTALTEQNLYTALSTVIKKITEYMFVGDVLLFRKMQGEFIYKKQMEWNSKGLENRRYNQVYEEIDVREFKDIIPLIRHMKVICYQKGEIPQCIQRPLAARRIRSMIIMLIELQEEENVILTFCNKRADNVWTKEQIVFLRKISNIIKVILQRMIEKRKLIYIKSNRDRF